MRARDRYNNKKCEGVPIGGGTGFPHGAKVMPNNCKCDESCCSTMPTLPPTPAPPPTLPPSITGSSTPSPGDPLGGLGDILNSASSTMSSISSAQGRAAAAQIQYVYCETEHTTAILTVVGLEGPPKFTRRCYCTVHSNSTLASVYV